MFLVSGNFLSGWWRRAQAIKIKYSFIVRAKKQLWASWLCHSLVPHTIGVLELSFVKDHYYQKPLTKIKKNQGSGIRRMFLKSGIKKSDIIHI